MNTRTRYTYILFIDIYFSHIHIMLLIHVETNNKECYCCERTCVYNISLAYNNIIIGLKRDAFKYLLLIKY